MKRIIYIGILIFIFNSCANKYSSNYNFGSYQYSTVGIRNENDGNIIVKTIATGNTYDEVMRNAQKKAINDIFLKGIQKGCEDCIKPALFLNRQNDIATKDFIQQFFQNPKNLDNYTSITKELATWEQKRDLKYTQNLPIEFEVYVRYSDLEKLIKSSVNYE